MKKRNTKFANPGRLGIALLIVGVVVLLVAGWLIDKDGKFSDESVHKSQPYIEVSQFNDDVSLVGDVVLEWMNGETSGSELYDKYSGRGRVYSSKSVTVYYAIYNIPNDTSIVKQEVELSQNASYENAVKYTLGSDKRSVRFDYLFVNTDYYYRIQALTSDGKVIKTEGKFKTADTPRIIALDSVRNLRDIGGLTTVDGKVLKQGLLYRGTEIDGAEYERYTISDSDIDVMTKQLGIKTEIDLRATNTPNMQNVLGESVCRDVYGLLAYADLFKVRAQGALKAVMSDLADKDKYPVYVHCTYGKDRTGTLCHFLLSLLGVSEEDAYKEWELSVLFDGTVDYVGMQYYLDAFKSLPGDTMQEKAERYLLSIGVTEQEIASIREIFLGEDAGTGNQQPASSLENKKIVYDGDSICAGIYGGGGYAQLIANQTGSKMENLGVGGGRLVPCREGQSYHSVVDNLVNLPTDGDLYCFEGGINDYWTYGVLGTYDPLDYDGELDTSTVCGAIETIFRYAREHFADRPIVFIIPHKIQGTAFSKNPNGDTFQDYRDAMVALCEKYSVFCYDAFTDSGLDGSDEEQNKRYLTGNAEGIPDGTHPNIAAYQEFYVPQLIELFEKALSG